MLSDDIIKFISDFSGVKCQKITINTTLLGDLGIDGEDAENLMLEYSKKFSVDLSEFVFNRYFNNEFPNSIFDILKKSNLEPIFVDDLITSAEFGRWVKNQS